jgi:23S rRNA (cytidine1920-2'-O)/16S rRNA (cytidine1409-2'-O)-methyltransferase
MPKQRLDILLVEAGLAESRARAQALILEGKVLVTNQRIDKPGRLVDSNAEIRIKGETLRYVGRGGVKLEAALREFNIEVSGKTCIDVGASTGGFTDCLLQHGAERIWAVDVGHNQLAWKLRQDPRVVVMERVNARNLDSAAFSLRFDVATIDVSFISLTRILPAVSRIVTDDAECITLIKPQFEVGKGEVGSGGIVTDPAKHKRVLREIRDAAFQAELEAVGLIASPILGAEGNREFLMHLKRTSTDPRACAIDEQIDSLTRPDCGF